MNYFILNENKEPIATTKMAHQEFMSSDNIDYWIVKSDVFELFENQVYTFFTGVSCETTEPKELFSTNIWANGYYWVEHTYNTWREAELGHLEVLEKYMGEFLV